MTKDRGAVRLGKLGGKARKLALTPERRSDIARLAVAERWRRAREIKKDVAEP